MQENRRRRRAAGRELDERQRRRVYSRHGSERMSQKIEPNDYNFLIFFAALATGGRTRERSVYVLLPFVDRQSRARPSEPNIFATHWYNATPKRRSTSCSCKLGEGLQETSLRRGRSHPPWLSLSTREDHDTEQRPPGEGLRKSLEGNERKNHDDPRGQLRISPLYTAPGMPPPTRYGTRLPTPPRSAPLCTGCRMP